MNDKAAMQASFVKTMDEMEANQNKINRVLVLAIESLACIAAGLNGQIEAKECLKKIEKVMKGSTAS